LRTQRAFEEWEALTRDFYDRARNGITPYVEAISHATAELARIQQELASLDRIQDTHSRLSQQHDEITEMEKQQTKRRQRLVLAHASRADASVAFRDTRAETADLTVREGIGSGFQARSRCLLKRSRPLV
jgi:hypothetical protein